MRLHQFFTKSNKFVIVSIVLLGSSLLSLVQTETFSFMIEDPKEPEILPLPRIVSGIEANSPTPPIIQKKETEKQTGESTEKAPIIPGNKDSKKEQKNDEKESKSSKNAENQFVDLAERIISNANSASDLLKQENLGTKTTDLQRKILADLDQLLNPPPPPQQKQPMDQQPMDQQPKNQQPMDQQPMNNSDSSSSQSKSSPQDSQNTSQPKPSSSKESKSTEKKSPNSNQEQPSKSKENKGEGETSQSKPEKSNSEKNRSPQEKQSQNNPNQSPQQKTKEDQLKSQANNSNQNRSKQNAREQNAREQNRARREQRQKERQQTKDSTGKNGAKKTNPDFAQLPKTNNPAMNSSNQNPKEKPKNPLETDHSVAEVYKDIWGHLPEKMRQEMDSYYREQFMPRYADLLKQYYMSLAKEKKLK